MLRTRRRTSGSGLDQRGSDRTAERARAQYRQVDDLSAIGGASDRSQSRAGQRLVMTTRPTGVEFEASGITASEGGGTVVE